MVKRGVSLVTRKGRKSFSKRRGQALVVKNKTTREREFNSQLQELGRRFRHSGTGLLPLSFPHYVLM